MLNGFDIAMLAIGTLLIGFLGGFILGIHLDDNYEPKRDSRGRFVKQ